MKNPKDIVFPTEETKNKLMEISKKYGIFETPEQMIKTIKSGRLASVGIIYSIIEKMAQRKINDEEVIREIKNNFLFDNERAQEFFNEIKNQIIPLGEKRGVINKEQTKKQIPINPYREPIE